MKSDEYKKGWKDAYERLLEEVCVRDLSIENNLFILIQRLRDAE